VKTAREQLDILTTYAELGSYRATAALCGTTHKTVRRVVERRGRPQAERPARPRVTDPVLGLIAAKVKRTDGRISAKRLLPLCRAEGYSGSGRSLRRAVAEAKAEHRRDRRTYRPWQPVPGEHLVFDWGEQDGLQVFCAVLAWSRWRFVRFARRQDQATTLAMLAECFELLGGVPGVLLTDRMGCLKGGVVADIVVPAPGYVTFAAHYGFRPDFCEAGDPESNVRRRHYKTDYGLIRIVPAALVMLCAITLTSHVPGASVVGSRKMTCLKSVLATARTSSARILKSCAAASLRKMVIDWAVSLAPRFNTNTATRVFGSAAFFSMFAALLTGKGSRVSKTASKVAS